MIIIKIEGKSHIDVAIKKLRNKFIATQVPKQLAQRKHFVKKSVKARNVLKKARYLELKKRPGL